MNGAIWFISAVLEAAMPFLIAAACLTAYMLIATAIKRFIQRGLRRRRERLNQWSTDPRAITDREIESLR